MGSGQGGRVVIGEEVTVKGDPIAELRKTIAEVEAAASVADIARSTRLGRRIIPDADEALPETAKGKWMSYAREFDRSGKSELKVRCRLEAELLPMQVGTVRELVAG